MDGGLRQCNPTAPLLLEKVCRYSSKIENGASILAFSKKKREDRMHSCALSSLESQRNIRMELLSFYADYHFISHRNGQPIPFATKIHCFRLFRSSKGGLSRHHSAYFCLLSGYLHLLHLINYFTVFRSRNLKSNYRGIQRDVLRLQLVYHDCAAPYHEYNHADQSPCVCQFDFE